MAKTSTEEQSLMNTSDQAEDFIKMLYISVTSPVFTRDKHVGYFCSERSSSLLTVVWMEKLGCRLAASLATLSVRLQFILITTFMKSETSEVIFTCLLFNASNFHWISFPLLMLHPDKSVRPGWKQHDPRISSYLCNFQKRLRQCAAVCSGHAWQ